MRGNSQQSVFKRAEKTADKLASRVVEKKTHLLRLHSILLYLEQRINDIIRAEYSEQSV